MNTNWKLIVAGLAAASLIACGGGEDEQVESHECGENTVEEDGECVPEYPDECGEDEVRDEELGDCVRAPETYCAEGAQLDDTLGVCRADEDLECGDETVEDDEECVPEIQKECGGGTIAFQGECVPDDEVCGDGTEDDDGTCRPAPDVCGEGTTFDFAERHCIPESTLECGGGTTADEDFVCVGTTAFYEALAEDPDLDLTDGEAQPHLELAEPGESVVFVGNIDEPHSDDGEWVQDEDYVEFDAEAGQWLRVTVYSMGLPEPGFVFSTQNGDVDYYRLTDLGAGIEVTREFAIPSDDTQQLTISNLPQMLDEVPPAGGDDWGYVGRIETMETPEADEVELLDGFFDGDIRDLSDNFYHVTEADQAEAAAMFFGVSPDHSEAEFQVWSDEFTHEQTVSIDGAPKALDTSDDAFYLLFDRTHAYGQAIDYEAHVEEGQSAEVGETITEEIALEAGEYVGVFQDNLDESALSASIYDDDGATVASTSNLEVSTAEEGQNSLYWYADSDTDVTLEVENTSGADIDYLVMSTDEDEADAVDGIDGELVEVDYDPTMSRGQRHYFELDIEFNDLLSVSVDGLSSARLELYDENQNLVDDDTDTIITEIDEGHYVLSVEAQGTMSGFTLHIEESQIFELVETSSPSASIPDGGSTSDDLVVDNCPNINEIEVHLDITHSWLSELIVDLEAPSGTSANLHNMEGGSSSDIDDTYPDPDDSANLGSGDDLYDLVGTDGSGTWTLSAEDTTSFFTNFGTINSWTLYLTCEG